MATSFTLALFETALKDAVEDQGTEFDGKVDELIRRGEDRVLMDLDLEIFDEDGTLTFSNGSRLATLPTDMIKARSVYFTSSGSVVFMEERSREYILDYWPGSGTGTPKYFAHYSATQLFVGPTPGANPASGTVRGIKRPASLVDTANGTWLSKNVGLLLLHATIIEALKHNVSDDRVQMFEAEYRGFLMSAQKELRHLRRKEFTEYSEVGLKPKEE
jgi:hypothetical protein